MDAEEILKDEYKEYSESVISSKRERLFGIVSGGMSKQYLGKEFQVSDLLKKWMITRYQNYIVGMKQD